MSKYFLYARKSTDEEDRQIMSINAQLFELKEFAAKEKLEIVASFQEAKTAKEPGRTVFGQMLDRIEQGEATGIIAWHPDRLARNSVDGGRVIYLTDKNKIESLKFPTFWFENTPQGKFMLTIAFGQSKYYVDNLAENVKRGIREKLRRGQLPGKAPLGYYNDFNSRTVKPDPKQSKIVRKLFQLFVTGEWPFYSLAEHATKIGLISLYHKSIATSLMRRILTNPFYYGVFKYDGEYYQGTHEPIITKKLFDEVQAIIRKRGRARKRPDIRKWAFTGLIKCGSCGCYVTAEPQKGHIYYRCTKKRGSCPEKYLREEALIEQVKEIATSHAIPKDWIDKMLAQLEKERETSQEAARAQKSDLRAKIEPLNAKLDQLLEMKLDRSITLSEYLEKKEKLLNQKVSLEQKMTEISRKGLDWLEPMKEFLLLNKDAEKVALSGDPVSFRSFLKNIGSNFLLKDQRLGFVGNLGWSAAAERRLTNWWTTCVRLRTWLFETTDFYLPDLKIETDHDGSVTKHAKSA